MEYTNPAVDAMALLTIVRGLFYLFLFTVSAQSLSAGSAPAPGAILTTNYLTLAGQPVGTPLTVPMLYTNVISSSSGNFIVVFSPDAAGQFSVSTNGPALAGPIRPGKAISAGAAAPAIQLSNVLNFSTIEFALPGTHQSYLSVSGFVKVPALWNTPATYDLIVLASVLEAPPYSTEDWTLQLNCGETNLVQFEHAGGTCVKYGATPYPANTWLYFTMVMDTTNQMEYGAVFNATDGALITSYTNRMELTNSSLNYWLFGNNEAGSQPGACFYFAGLNWSNTPLPSLYAQEAVPMAPSPRGYVLTAGQLVQFWKSTDLQTWAAVGPVTNRLVLPTPEAAAGYFRAQAVAHLNWAPAPSARVNGYVVTQWFEPAPGTLVSTNIYVARGQTNLCLPLRGMGTNWFSVAANTGGQRGVVPTRVAWGPVLFKIAMAPF